MADCLSLLEQALDLGERERDYIAAGRVAETQETALLRGKLIEQAWAERDEACVDVDVLLDKLRRLRNLQGQLSSEAKRLHANLEKDLAKAKKETRRLDGYKGAATFRPNHNRFVSKRG